MCDRPKIHVFLGAPPPSSTPALVSEAGVEGEERLPAGWRHLELTWQDGQLRPATDEAGNRTSRENVAAEDDDQCSASVQEYLDSCFPAAQPGPEPKPEPEPEHLSAQTQYLTTWTLSQALILRGRCGIQSTTSPEKTPPPPPQTPPRHTQTPPSASSSTPELFSPVTLSPGASAELFSEPCLTPRVEEGGVVVEATTDGVLCSQEAEQRVSTPAQDSPAKPPDSKRARSSEDQTTEASAAAATATAAGLRGPTTLLSRCDKRRVRYSVLVAVVHPSHLKEVKVKSGPTAGTFVPLASIVVTDQSGVEMKVVLWRRAAFWALTVSPGDVLLITGLQVNDDRWRGETVLQSTFSSKLLNLGQIAASTCPLGAVWDFRVLLVTDGLTSDLPELHSTPWSSVRPLEPDDRRAQSFLQPPPRQTGNSSSVELDLATLLSQKYSGDVELRVEVAAFHFQDSRPSQNAPQPVLDSSTPLDGILAALSGDITYTGCGRCSAELDTDANGIYDPCYPCLPHTAVRRYYRPGVLTVSRWGSSQLCVQVPPVPLEKILEAPPDKLHRSSAPGSQVKFIQAAAERLQTLLALPRKTFIVTVRSHFLCDENSVPISQDFTLLDLQFPA